MYKPRRIETSPHWIDDDGGKIYTLSAHGQGVSRHDYYARLQTVKDVRAIGWAHTPHFIIFHDGNPLQYLVFAGGKMIMNSSPLYP